MKMSRTRRSRLSATSRLSLNANVQRPEMMKKNDELAMATATARKLEKNPRYAAKYENYR